MMNWKNIEKYFFGRVARNTVFWLLFTLFHYDKGPVYYYFILLVVIVVSYGIPCYVNNFLLIPKFLYRQRYATYFSLFVLLLAATVVVSYYLTVWPNRLFEGLDYMGNLKDVAMPYHIFPSMLMFTMVSAGKFTTDAFRNQRKLEMMENEKLVGELSVLKSQINPHFLFNSLNTIYGLARRTDNETAESILKLSDILRYILYDCSVDMIGIEKELTFLHYYIDFVKLRNSKAKIHLDINTETNDQQIAPLLLLPFIENAIKHGLEKHINDSWIEIRIAITGNSLHFECLNSNYNRKRQGERGSKPGIGLRNVERRLELLYKDRYHLETESHTNIYKVKLNIELV